MTNPISKKPAWEEEFDELLDKIITKPETPPVIFKLAKIKSFIRQTRKEAVREALKETIKKVERIKLDMDVVICDCGEPYKDSDPADLINEFVIYLKKRILKEEL